MSTGHMARKQELRELKILQKQEQKAFQDLGIKANAARAEQERKFEAEKTQFLRAYDNDLEALTRHQKQQVGGACAGAAEWLSHSYLSGSRRVARSYMRGSWQVAPVSSRG